ncbi:MAG: hypothetical protein ACI9DF_003945 [Verrucomicrobiales bacterium]|jgi:uncharacterized protein (TIGR02598 family)
MKLTPQQLSPRRSSAFTLIEVTIAMAIVATVMMALLGLLPMSLDQMREARNMTSMARISEDIINDVQLMKWEEMERLDGEIREYNDQGTRVRNATEKFQIVYSAEIEVELEGIFVPGQTEERNDYAKRITIYMGPSREESVNMKMLSETNDKYTKVSTVIARMDEQKDKK